MTTYYVDYNNGNDANSGADWANAWKTLSKVTGPTGGDVIRIAKSPDPTSLGTGAWTSTPDSGSQFPPLAKTITAGGITTGGTVNLTAHGWATGDVIWISGHTNNTRGNGVWSITYIGVNSFSLDNFPSVFGTTGTSTGGSTTTLIDTGRNFRVDGVVIGDKVTKTVGGNTSTVTGIFTTTNPHDTLEFGALTGGGTFAGGAAYAVDQQVGTSNGSAYNINYRVVRLSDAPVAVIDGADEKNDWVASANVTILNDTTNYKSGLRSVQFSIGPTFGTGKIAYKTLSTTNIDLSAYQQVAFWIKVDNPGSVAPCTITGTATAGSGASKLIDTTKNFTTLGVTVGSQVMRALGAAPWGNGSSLVTSISTTTNPNDTLNFAALPGELAFAVGNAYSVYPLTFRIKLCSDATGDTAVDDLLVPTPIPTGAVQWIPVVINKGSALGSTIKSISFWTDIDPGTGINLINIDHIIACKATSSADSLTLQSLIGKNTADEPAWYGIGAVVGGTGNGARSTTDTRAGTPQPLPGTARKFLIIDGATSTDGAVQSSRGYSGVTEAVTTYKRDTIKTILLGESVNSNAGGIGASGNLPGTYTWLEYQGGYNTSSSSQDGETYFDGLCGYGIGIIATTKTYIKVNKIYTHRYHQGFTCGSFNYWGEMGTANNGNVANSGVGIAMSTNNYFEDVKYVNNNGIQAASNTSGIIYLSGANGNFVKRIRSISNNQGPIAVGAVTLSSSINNILSVDYIRNNTTRAIVASAPTASTSGNNIVRNFTSSLNLCTRLTGTGSEGSILTGGIGYFYFDHVYIYEALAVAAFAAGDTGKDQRTIFHNYQKTANSHRQVHEQGEIWGETTTVHTPGGVSWRFSPTSITDPGGRHHAYPMKLPLARVAVAANKLVTIKAYLRRDSTNMMMQLVCRMNQLAGITADQIASITAAANTWEQVTITFTPTEVGVVEIEAWGYLLAAGTLNGWVDDMTISQAG